MSTNPVYLRDVLDIPEDVHAGSFKVELTGSIKQVEARLAEYVVTDQLRDAFDKALGIVRAAVRDGSSHAAYLHGSFGSGKSHFLTVLHAVLNNHPAARAKPGLQPVIADHDDWLRGKKFLMVPYHLVGATDLDSAILGGYVSTVRALHPGKPSPPVYRADAMLDDARRSREAMGDAAFVRWLTIGSDPATGGPGAAADEDDDDLDLQLPGEDTDTGWTGERLDRAFGAPAGDPVRDQLVQDLLSGPMSSYIRGATGDADAFLPLENGLSIITKHARDLGYDGLILFLDELILWLQARMVDRQFVNTQVSKLVKLIESGDAGRVLPIVSFISRQRDLSKLVGEDVTGAEVKELERQVEYLAGRFDTVSLEDRNLPAIIKERVLTPKPGGREILDAAFASIESAKPADREVLLDAAGATGADWQDFRDVYPLSPALLNVLVALSGALQRERTGLKLLQEMLRRRRDDMKVGELIPLGDLWDVLADGVGEAFTDRLRREAEAAHRFYAKVRAWLLERHGGADNQQFRATDRLVKTLILAALAPQVPALTRLTGPRLAALNHGSLRARTVSAGSLAVKHLRELQAEFGELRHEGEEDPVFRLQLSDLDVEPYLDAVGEQDTTGARRIWTRQKLWEELDIKDSGDFVCERDIVWKGTRRTAEFVFANVRDEQELADAQFLPSTPGRIRFILDYPFDDSGEYTPRHDAQRIHRMRRSDVTAATVVWLPHFFSAQKSAQLGRLLKIQYLLERNRLDDFARTRSADERIKIRHQLEAQCDTLESQLVAALRQLYGISGGDDSTIGAPVGEDGHVLSLFPGHKPRLAGGAGFAYNVLTLADGLFDTMYPKHPNFDPNGNRKAVTSGELRTVYEWITKAMEDGSRRVVVDRNHLALVRRIVHPLELGEVTDGPLNVSVEWRRRIEQAATQHGVTGDLRIEDIREWIAELGYTGLDKLVLNLIIATYALLADRTWTLHGSVLRQPPELDRIGPGHALRAQELPGATEFATARERAAALFGVVVPDTRFARNINRLAEEVRGKVAALEAPVNGVRRMLDRHAAALGIPDGTTASDKSTASDPSGESTASDAQRTAPRIAATRDAAELLARLAAANDATDLVNRLAAATFGTRDTVLAATISAAPALLDALNTVEWSLVTSVRGFSGRGDLVGNRADAMLDELVHAATSDEFTVALGPVLGTLKDRAVALVTEAARLAAVVEPSPAPPAAATRSAEEGTGEQRADAVSLTDNGRPGVSGTAPETALTPASAPASTPTSTPAGAPAEAPAGRKARRVRASAAERDLATLLAGLREEIRDYARAHPGAEIEIEWRTVGGEDSAR
ncbi:PglY protein [Saccharomonospora xinjiangensis]|uniref:PglY protein n=1 Tax=Saccharomonospora xinjiangensis TaxID=75294 RepID=UPI00106FA9B6|nr:PglY protein [Saccharomonospora xinjiangensis]QBQ58968.1 hypothetical protein EYD13_02925 [Saccharomonospora xinjiangensis]